MAAEDPKVVLAKVYAEARKQYPRNPSRLAQLEAAVATAAMALEALADEEVRHSDLAQRVRDDIDGAAERSRHQLNNLHPQYKKAG